MQVSILATRFHIRVEPKLELRPVADPVPEQVVSDDSVSVALLGDANCSQFFRCDFKHIT